jgi:hypothetical protein
MLEICDLARINNNTTSNEVNANNRSEVVV